jgi:acetoacetyl-CoA reductase
MDERLDGQVALVTGGSRGIGRAICEHLAGRGAMVAAGYSRDEVSAASLRDSLPGRITIHQGNIGSVADCEAVVDDVLRAHGQIDILVNNAGITADRTVRRMSSEDWDRVVRVNLSGAFYMTRAALDHMVAREYGRIVNISSVIGETGNVGQANYAAAKSGLFGLTRTLALETARKGITVNCVAPGFIATDMVASVPEAALGVVIGQIPVGRLGEPEEVARVVDFLVARESAYITGTIIQINGGMHM